MESRERLLSMKCCTHHVCAGTLPASWADHSAFPALLTLTLSNLRVTGTLPAVWGSHHAFPLLKTLQLIDFRLSGELTAGLDCDHLYKAKLAAGNDVAHSCGQHALGCSMLTSGPRTAKADISMSACKHNKAVALHIKLSPVKLVVSSVRTLDYQYQLPVYDSACAGTCILCTTAGTLPAAWGDQGFSALSHLEIWEQQLTGSLPAEWGSNGSFPVLEKLYLGACGLTGTLPSTWGSNSSFKNLSLLSIGLCSGVKGI